MVRRTLARKSRRHGAESLDGSGQDGVGLRRVGRDLDLAAGDEFVEDPLSEPLIELEPRRPVDEEGDSDRLDRRREDIAEIARPAQPVSALRERSA